MVFSDMAPDGLPREPMEVTPVGTAAVEDERVKRMTLEAFADTMIPGERRFPGDRTVAGAAPGPGAVAAGAVELLETPAAGIDRDLPELVTMLNEHARGHAERQGLDLDPDVPAFVALPFAERTALAQALLAPGHPENEAWILVALFCVMAFDTGAHMHTLDAIAQGHPGLVHMGLESPDPDGLWRFPSYSYGRRLADMHHDTTSSGSPR
ncbi:hypothetical protein GCM10010182_13170 [Actinomadura cremea]|nr:hypothetical protein GCM10010182_13170 [Actinomadura cremea]